MLCQTNWFSSRNAVVPFFDSTGSTLFFAGIGKSFAFISKGAESPRFTSEWWMSQAGTRGYMRELFYVSLGAMAYKKIETIVWLALGILGLAFADTEPMQQALRSAVEFVANAFFAVTGAIGGFYKPMTAYRFAFGSFVAAGALFEESINPSDKIDMVKFFCKKVTDSVKGAALVGTEILGEESEPSVVEAIDAFVENHQTLKRMRELANLDEEHLKAEVDRFSISPTADRDPPRNSPSALSPTEGQGR